MKGGLLILMLLAGSLSAQSQSLKELLFSGKLRNDSNTVVRKTDDLSTKIGTGTRKPEAPAAMVAATDGATAGTPATAAAPDDTNATTLPDTVAVAATEPAATPAAPAAPVKSNNRLWREYTDSLAGPLKTEVLSNKKIRKETYYLTVEYEIATDGAVDIINVLSAPENALLQAMVKDKMMAAPPRLNPVTDSSQQARKVKRKYNFSITKE